MTNNGTTISIDFARALIRPRESNVNRWKLIVETQMNSFGCDELFLNERRRRRCIDCAITGKYFTWEITWIRCTNDDAVVEYICILGMKTRGSFGKNLKESRATAAPRRENLWIFECWKILFEDGHKIAQECLIFRVGTDVAPGSFAYARTRVDSVCNSTCHFLHVGHFFSPTFIRKEFRFAIYRRRSG